MAKEIPEKLKDYVVTDLPRYSEVGGHHAPVPFWIAPNMFPGVHVEVAGSEASTLVGNPHAVPHTHTFPEIYMCVSPNKGAVVAEIQMGEDKFTVESPFAVFVPPETVHAFWVLKCDSPNYIFGLGIQDWKKP